MTFRFRPFRALWTWGIGITAYLWFGWWAVLLLVLMECDLEVRR
jgi:hypothetical protein